MIAKFCIFLGVAWIALGAVSIATLAFTVLNIDRPLSIWHFPVRIVFTLMGVALLLLGLRLRRRGLAANSSAR